MGVDAQMYVSTDYAFTDKEVQRWAADLASATFDVMWHEQPGQWSTEGRRCLEEVAEYEQDGPTIIASADERLIEVHLNGRYYGEGYERGNLPDYIAVAEWLERRIPGAKVYYGGDSSGCVAERFDKKARARLLDHWAAVDHGPYNSAYSGLGNPRCDFDDQPLVAYGWSANATAYSCSSCHMKGYTLKEGAPFVAVPANEKRDIFDLIREARAEVKS